MAGEMKAGSYGFIARDRGTSGDSALMLRILLLVHLPVLFLFRGHVMTDRAAAGGTKHAMVVCHVAGNTPDDGALDAALGVGGCCHANNQGETGNSR
jgi:hypothetical protein